MPPKTPRSRHNFDALVLKPCSGLGTILLIHGFLGLRLRTLPVQLCMQHCDHLFAVPLCRAHPDRDRPAVAEPFKTTALCFWNGPPDNTQDQCRAKTALLPPLVKETTS